MDERKSEKDRSKDLIFKGKNPNCRLLLVCAPGVGDALIMHIASHHLSLHGFDVTIDSPHRFGRWFAHDRFGQNPVDAIFLQHDNSENAKRLYQLPLPVYTFFGSHKESKHGPLRPSDFVCNPNQTMVENVVHCLKTLFQIDATKNTGITPPLGLIHRKYRKRVLIHATSSSETKNWPLKKYNKIAKWLEAQGYEPTFCPLFPSLDGLCSFIYESGYFLGNDSGPGHIASCFNIPQLIIGQDEKLLRLWRPGWNQGEILTPPPWAPKKHWKSFIFHKNVINLLKTKVLSN